MLSVAQCRTLLPGAGEGLTDVEVERLRDGLAAIAGTVLDGARPHGKAATAAEVFQMMPTDLREVVEESAAIMEFDGKVPRDRAERAAVAQALGWRQED